jgi:hypothetical protein
MMSDKFDQMAAERDELYQAKPVRRRKGYIARWIEAMLREDANMALARAHMNLWQTAIEDYVAAKRKAPQDGQ